MTIPFAAAMLDGLYERVLMVAKAKGATLPPKEQWDAEIRASYGEDAEEELDCIPQAGTGALIKPEDLAACEHHDAATPELYPGGIDRQSDGWGQGVSAQVEIRWGCTIKKKR